MKILIISGVGWNENFQRQQKIATEICALGHEVHYMQGFVTAKFRFRKVRTYLLKVINKSPSKHASLFKNPKPDNLQIISTFTLPSSNFFFDFINAAFLVRKKSYKYDLLISYLPVTSVQLFINSLPSKPYIIYDCVRNFPDWPGYPDNMAIQERNFLNYVDDIWVDSFWLKRKFENYGYSPKHLKPTVDTNIFNMVKTSTGKIRNLVYYGLISNKIDFTIISMLIDSGYSVTLIGPKDSGIVLDSRINYIPQSSQKYIVNYIYLYADGLIIPYKSSGMDGVIPAKTIECLSFGLPTFISSFFDSRELSEYFYVYQDGDCLLNLIKNLDSSEFGLRRERGLQFVSENNNSALRDFILDNIHLVGDEISSDN